MIQFTESGYESSASDRQIGGAHYVKLAITPREYGFANNLDFDQINIIKYVTRHKDKNGKQDILKAIHYCELLLEREYSA